MWYLFQGRHEHGKVKLSTYLDSGDPVQRLIDENLIEEILEEDYEETELP